MMLAGTVSTVMADLPYVQKDGWRETITASIQAGEQSKKSEPKPAQEKSVSTFGKKLYAGFPESGPIIMAARDWLRQDKLSLEMP